MNMLRRPIQYEPYLFQESGHLAPSGLVHGQSGDVGVPESPEAGRGRHDKEDTAIRSLGIGRYDGWLRYADSHFRWGTIRDR